MKIEIKPEPASVCGPVLQEIFRSQVAHDRDDKSVTIHIAILPQWIFAWDRGGPWQDPSYPHKDIFSPVTSVPYWDERCGHRFSGLAEFEARLSLFWDHVQRWQFVPRN